MQNTYDTSTKDKVKVSYCAFIQTTLIDLKIHQKQKIVLKQFLI